MTRKYLEARRQRNRELAAMDAKNRCGYCRISLVGKKPQFVWGDPLRYCSEDCVEASHPDLRRDA